MNEAEYYNPKEAVQRLWDYRGGKEKMRVRREMPIGWRPTGTQNFKQESKTTIEYYTPLFRYCQGNSASTLILRHFPSLFVASLTGGDNG